MLPTTMKCVVIACGFPRLGFSVALNFYPAAEKGAFCCLSNKRCPHVEQLGPFSFQRPLPVDCRKEVSVFDVGKRGPYC